MGRFMLRKNTPKMLVTGLSHREFQCKCRYDHCRGTIIKDKLLWTYQRMRETLDTPCTINSGYRCSAHNKDIGGKPLSRHLLGEALDISYSTLKSSFDVLQIKQIARDSGFTFVKFYEGVHEFFHMDVR